MYYWQTIFFNTRIEQKEWYFNHKAKYQISEIFVNHGFAYDYKKLKSININYKN